VGIWPEQLREHCDAAELTGPARGFYTWLVVAVVDRRTGRLAGTSVTALAEDYRASRNSVVGWLDKLASLVTLERGTLTLLRHDDVVKKRSDPAVNRAERRGRPGTMRDDDEQSRRTARQSRRTARQSRQTARPTRDDARERERTRVSLETLSGGRATGASSPEGSSPSGAPKGSPVRVPSAVKVAALHAWKVLAGTAYGDGYAHALPWPADGAPPDRAPAEAIDQARGAIADAAVDAVAAHAGDVAASALAHQLPEPGEPGLDAAWPAVREALEWVRGLAGEPSWAPEPAEAAAEGTDRTEGAGPVPATLAGPIDPARSNGRRPEADDEDQDVPGAPLETFVSTPAGRDRRIAAMAAEARALDAATGEDNVVRLVARAIEAAERAAVARDAGDDAMAAEADHQADAAVEDLGHDPVTFLAPWRQARQPHPVLRRKATCGRPKADGTPCLQTVRQAGDACHRHAERAEAEG
jgi:hypothetical protein